MIILNFRLANLKKLTLTIGQHLLKIHTILFMSQMLLLGIKINQMEPKEYLYQLMVKTILLILFIHHIFTASLFTMFLFVKLLTRICPLKQFK